MVVMVIPAACSARSALSRPEPGPETLTSRVRTPCSAAFLPASSAAIWAAYGVDLREPLKPIMPALDHEMVLPCASVMVIIVLLNEAFTCATPEVMFLRSRFLTRAGSLAIGPSYFFLPAIGLAGPLRVRALVWVRWPRTGRPLRCLNPRQQPTSLRRLMFVATSRLRAP